MANHKMAVLQGVRYRPEDVPAQQDDAEAESVQGATAQPKARRRPPKPKGGTDGPAA